MDIISTSNRALPTQIERHSEGVQLWIAAQNSLCTRENYARHVARFIAIIEKRPEDATLADLQHYIAIVKNPPAEMIGWNSLFRTRPSATSAVAAIQAIQSLYSFMHRAGVIQLNPALLIRVPSAHTKKRVNMSSALDFVIRCATLAQDITAKEKDRTAGFAVLLLTMTGLRASEAGDAVMEQVFCRDGRTWLSVIGKGDKARDVVLPDFLLSIRASLPQSDWLIPEKLRGSGSRTVVWRMVKRAAALSGTDEKLVHPHLLRHVHTSFLLKNGVTLVEARDNVGHGNIAVTSRYAHSAEDARHDAITAALAGITVAQRANNHPENNKH